MVGKISKDIGVGVRKGTVTVVSFVPTLFGCFLGIPSLYVSSFKKNVFLIRMYYIAIENILSMIYRIHSIRRRSRLVAALDCRLTSRCAERNSRRSRILAAANIRVARAHVNKPRDSMAISKQAESIQWLRIVESIV